MALIDRVVDSFIGWENRCRLVKLSYAAMHFWRGRAAIAICIWVFDSGGLRRAFVYPTADKLGRRPANRELIYDSVADRFRHRSWYKHRPSDVLWGGAIDQLGRMCLGRPRLRNALGRFADSPKSKINLAFRPPASRIDK